MRFFAMCCAPSPTHTDALSEIASHSSRRLIDLPPLHKDNRHEEDQNLIPRNSLCSSPWMGYSGRGSGPPPKKTSPIPSPCPIPFQPCAQPSSTVFQGGSFNPTVWMPRRYHRVVHSDQSHLHQRHTHLWIPKLFMESNPYWGDVFSIILPLGPALRSCLQCRYPADRTVRMWGPCMASWLANQNIFQKIGSSWKWLGQGATGLWDRKSKCLPSVSCTTPKLLAPVR